VVTNAYGSVTSSVAVLTVTNSPYSPAIDFYFSTSAGAVTITGYKGNGGAVSIPNLINGLPVVAIQSSAFAGLFDLTSVTIPDSVITIGMLAFSDLYGLTNVVIGNGVTTVGGAAFAYNSDLRTVVLGTNITTIASSAFNSCPRLTAITTIPRSVTSIGPSAFNTGSTYLTGLTVDPLNPAYASLDGVLFDKGLATLMVCPGGRSGNYLIPASVTTVAMGAFYNCQHLTGVTIPASVTNLGSSAFLNCSGLASITLPNSIATIGDKTFFNCANLASVSIPGSVTAIGFEAFRNCYSLQNVSIPGSVTTIADGAFTGCYGLRSVAFQGNAPGLGGANVFFAATNAMVFYLAGTTEWGPAYGGRPTALYLGVPFTENFEAGLPGSWTQEYVTGAKAWIAKKGGNGSPQNPHPGGGGALNALLFGSGVATRLVTPMIDLGTATAAQLTFWLDMKIYNIYQDQMRVYYKTSPAGPWILLQSYSYCSSWTQFALNLPTPSRTYYIAFEAIGNGGYGVCLDDVTVTATAFPVPPAIASSGLPSGVVGTDYSQALAASGGTTPYMWSVASGTLPSGLSLSSGGVISGNPSTAATTSIGLRVIGADSLSSTSSFHLTINKAPTINEPLYAFTNFVGDPNFSGSADGTNNAARFDSPVGISVDSEGNLFVSDNGNHTLRKITPARVVTTLAGLAGTSGANDGAGGSARFYNPAGTAVDTNGLVYVADQNNNTIRAITPGGVVTTIAGTAGQSGIDLNDTNNWYRYLNMPAGVAVGGGDCYIVDTDISMVARVKPPYPDIFLVVGYTEGSADGTGPQAQFRWPEGIAFNNGVLYIADTGNQIIRRISPDRVVTTVAGSPGLYGSSDGAGSSARFDLPAAVTADANGNLFVADRGNHVIRKITPTGVVTTIGGLAGVAGSTDEAGNAARFNSPSGIAVDADGVLYIADKSNHRVTKGTPIYPAVITAASNGLDLNLSWPANFLGWELQVQTNTLSTNWTGVAGSTSTIQMSIPLDKNSSAKFFRLHKP
jgi:sugar lactone lactonase YvrE